MMAGLAAFRPRARDAKRLPSAWFSRFSKSPCSPILTMSVRRLAGTQSATRAGAGASIRATAGASDLERWLRRCRHHPGSSGQSSVQASSCLVRCGIGGRLRAPLACRPFSHDAQAAPEPLCSTAGHNSASFSHPPPGQRSRTSAAQHCSSVPKAFRNASSLRPRTRDVTLKPQPCPLHT